MNGILVLNVRENSRVTIMSALLIQKIGLLSTQGLNITSAHTAIDNLSVEPPRHMLSHLATCSGRHVEPGASLKHVFPKTCRRQAQRRIPRCRVSATE